MPLEVKLCCFLKKTLLCFALDLPQCKPALTLHGCDGNAVTDVTCYVFFLLMEILNNWCFSSDIMVISFP